MLFQIHSVFIQPIKMEKRNTTGICEEFNSEIGCSKGDKCLKLHLKIYENSLESLHNECITLLSQRLQNSLNFGQFTDFEIILGFEKKKILTHRMVLHATSPFFQKFFDKNPNEKSYYFKDFDYQYFQVILKWMYSGDINYINIDNALETLLISDILEISFLRECCCEIFSTKSIYLIESKQFLKFSFEIIKTFISSDNFSVSDEFLLFQRIVQWAEGDKKKIEKLKPYIRFTLIPIENLEIIEKQGYLNSNELNSILKKKIKKEIKKEKKLNIL